MGLFESMKTPKLEAVSTETAAGTDGAEGEDKSLPDPTGPALWFLAVSRVVAIVAALVINGMGWTNAPWDPPEGDFNFALFAALYAGAQIIERLMELLAPLLPAFPPAGKTGEARVAHVKANRAKVSLGVASVLGVVTSGAFGIFFLETMNIESSNTVDSLVTGLLIAAGTKPLHDFIDLLQDQNNPQTSTEVP
jgi:hypothetical protein